MSIKNLVKKIFYLLIIVFLGTDITAREEYSWEYNLAKGEKQYASRMYNDAYDSMRMALKKNPECYKAANVLGHISVLKNDMHSAEKYYKISLGINDAQPGIHTDMGRIDEYFQRDDSALSHYNRSVELDPDNQKALINLARISFKFGKNTDAEKYFRKCYNNGISQSAELYKKGESMRRGNPRGAAHEFKMAIEANPAHVEVYIALADCYRQTGEYNDAVTVLEELKMNRPDFTLAYIYLGNIYYNNMTGNKLRKYHINLAVMNYEKALKLDPGNADIYFELAGIYKATGNIERAAELEKRGGELLKNGE